MSQSSDKQPQQQGLINNIKHLVQIQKRKYSRFIAAEVSVNTWFFMSVDPLEQHVW